MFALSRRISNLAKPFLNISRSFQVSVIGTSQHLGQSISLLLKQHQLIHRLTTCDAPKDSFGAYLPRSDGWTGSTDYALKGSDVVVVACGHPKKQGQTERDHFKQNADSVVDAMREIATHCPSAFIVVATDPINQTVPLASKVLALSDCFDKNKVFGVTGIDTIRTQMWVGGVYQLNPHYIKVPVICGRSSKTAVPLFSHIQPRFEIPCCTARFLTDQIRAIDNQMTSVKWQSEDTTLSSAFATYCTVSAILNAMNGYAIEHIAYVANNNYGTKFFASPVIITNRGISGMMQYKMVSPLEYEYIQKSSQQLCNDVREGETYYTTEKHNQKTKTADII